jgi:hypothetical protein
MKKEVQTDAQLSVLDAGRAIKIQKTKKRATIILAALVCVYGIATGSFLFGVLGLVGVALVGIFWRGASAGQVIDVQAISAEKQLKSRLDKLKFGDHPTLGEKATSLYDRYLIVFKQAEKILYEKLNRNEITAQRFQKVFDEMKENLQMVFEKIAQTLEISAKNNLDQASILEQLRSIEENLHEITHSMNSLQQTQVGSSNSTFDQSFLVEEMKKLTERIQKMD